MIVKVVEQVHACEECPNLSKEPSGHLSVNYLCNAAMKVIGNSNSMRSRLQVKNKVSELCPFKNDEVNQRPRRVR